MSFPGFFKQLSQEDKTLSEYIHNVLGFYPKNMALYKLAFTHKSKSDESVGSYHLSNERLEYLGDSVLNIVVADYLFRTFPTQAEGFLTEMRSRIVSRSSLNKLSQKLGFDTFIRHTPENDSVNSFRSIGGNAFEALMGAIYLDRGFEFSKRVITDRIIRVHIDIDQLEQTETNFKSRLLEWSQKHRKHLDFRLLDEKMEKHKKLYHVQIFIDDKGYAEAIDYSLKRAEQIAAEKTWNILAI